EHQLVSLSVTQRLAPGPAHLRAGPHIQKSLRRSGVGPRRFAPGLPASRRAPNPRRPGRLESSLTLQMASAPRQLPQSARCSSVCRFGKLARLDLGSTVDNFLFLKFFSHSLELTHFGIGMKLDAVGMKLDPCEERALDFLRSRTLLSAIGQANVQNKLIDLHWIIIGLAQLDLPGAYVRHVIKDMLELVEIDELAFHLVELHLTKVRAA